MLSFWGPDANGVVQNDMLWILRKAKKPVLAHAFLNFMLDEKNAYDNFVQFNGYSPPQNTIDGDSLVKKGLIPKSLAPRDPAARPVREQPGAARAERRRHHALAERLVEVQGRLSGELGWIWRALAIPGVVWLSVFFLVAMYAVLSVALGNQNTLNQPIPYWNPLDWNVGYLFETLRNIWHDGPFLKVFLRTVGYVAVAMAPVARDRLSRSPTTRPGTRGAGAASCCCCSCCRSGSTT